jgi:hypothetical protein
MNPQDQTPQIALVTQTTFAIIGAETSTSALFSHWPMPEVNCPIVDISKTPHTNLDEICKEHIGPSGVSDVPALVTALEKAGGVRVDYEKFVVEGGLNNLHLIPIELPEPAHVTSPDRAEQIISELYP